MKFFFNLFSGFFKLTGKLFFVFAVFFVILNLFFILSSRQKINISVDEMTKSQRQDIYRVINDKKYKNKDGQIAIALYRTGLCSLIGEACTDNPDDANKNFGESIFGQVTNLIAAPYAYQPASGVFYVYDGLKNAGFVPEAYAAEGIGFGAIRPLTNLWKIFRDISYLIIVLVIVAIGFMIMFRVKLNPQTVISIENALPKIILALILITFSFAIAGFMIDIMYVLTALSIATLAQNNVIHIDVAQTTHNVFFGSSWTLLDWVLVNQHFWKVGPAIFAIIPTVLALPIRLIAAVSLYNTFVRSGKLPIIGDLLRGEPVANTTQAGGLLSTSVKVIAFVLIFPLLTYVVPLVLSCFVFLTGLLIFFRILFMLLSNYIQIILLIIFSPLILLVEAIPGRSTFVPWLKNIFANLLAFPIVAILILVSGIIASLPSASGSFWQPPFLYKISPNAFGVLVGVALLFAIPNIVQIVKELMGAKGIPGVGAGGFFGGVGLVGGSLLGLSTQVGSLYFTASHLYRYMPAVVKQRLPEQLRQGLEAAQHTTTPPDTTHAPG